MELPQSPPQLLIVEPSVLTNLLSSSPKRNLAQSVAVCDIIGDFTRNRFLLIIDDIKESHKPVFVL